MQQVNRPEQAEHHLAKAAHWTPDDASTRTRWAFALLALGRHNDALTQFECAHQLGPNDPLTLVGLAWLLAACPQQEIRDGARALQLAERARSLAPADSVLNHRAIAAAHAELGDWQKALAAAKTAQALASAGGQSALGSIIESDIHSLENQRPLRLQSLEQP